MVFFSESKPTEPADSYYLKQTPLTIENMKKIENLISVIHGNDCGACGAPDCRTFAEDVVRGDADTEDCFKLRQG
ncbi:MAG: (Fe-S)-binding protein [Dissulfuribacterales bacterium]